MAEDEVNEADLSGRLATVLEEIRDVMEKRKQRIEELRQEITEIENDNDDLEKTISELMIFVHVSCPSRSRSRPPISCTTRRHDPDCAGLMPPWSCPHNVSLLPMISALRSSQ